MRTYTAKPVNSELVAKPQGSKLVVPGEGFLSGEAEFTELRDRLVYIYKTQFSIPISQYMAPVLCRPRRFGKTLTVGMLGCFHGVNHRDRYGKLFKVCRLGD